MKINEKFNFNANRGITLVALIITIIVLIILSAVAIKMFSDTHLITMASGAAQKYNQEEEHEHKELNRVEIFLRGDLGDITGAIEFGELEWSDKKASVTVTKKIEEDYKIQYKVINKDGETVREWTDLENGGKITELNLGDIAIVRLTDGEYKTKNTASIEVIDKIPPIVTVITKEVKSNKIEVETSVTDEQAGMPEVPEYRYYIKKSEDENYPDEPIHKGREKGCVFEGLEQGTSYDIKITSIDIAGNVGVGELKEVTTEIIPDAGDGSQTGAIRFDNLEWINKKASVTITKMVSEDYEIEYKILRSNGETKQEYEKIANVGRTKGASLGDVIVARLTDGTNHGKTASIEIQDNIAPKVTITEEAVKSNSITVTVSSEDREAGMPDAPVYSYYIKKSTDTKYPDTPSYTGTKTSIEFTNLDQTRNYDIKVEVLDIAGNKGTETKQIATAKVPSGSSEGGQAGAITFGSLTWENQKASVTITKTISENYKIEYKITDENGQTKQDYTEIANGGRTNGASLGDIIVARLTDGRNHGNTASIHITDGTAPTAPTLRITSGTEGSNGWYKSDVTVTITPGTDGQSGVAKTTYSITGTGAKAETEGTSVTISSEGTSEITAYTYDNAGNKTASAPFTVKVDKTDPTKASISITSSTANTITVKVEGADSVSKVAAYRFDYKEGNGNWQTKETKTTTQETYNYTYTGLNLGQTYTVRVVVIDGAGREKASTEPSKALNTAPTFTAGGSGTATGNTAMTIKATATDNEQSTLTYTLNYGTSTSYGKTKTVTGTTGQQVSFNLTSLDGLSNYTLYYWRVDVTDGVVTESVKGASGSTRTWCNLASYCKGWSTKYRTCSSCSGSGKKETQCTTCQGTGVVTKNCSLCGGSGKIQEKCTANMSAVRSGPSKCSVCGRNSYYSCYYKCGTCGATGGRRHQLF